VALSTEKVCRYKAGEM